MVLKLLLKNKQQSKLVDLISSKLGWFVLKIKSFRKPEPYKGKGIREKGQYILRKEGKKK